jgi:hypothetical protein
MIFLGVLTTDDSSAEEDVPTESPARKRMVVDFHVVTAHFLLGGGDGEQSEVHEEELLPHLNPFEVPQQFSLHLHRLILMFCLTLYLEVLIDDG